ncbi:MAG: RNase III inhibitor [Planctomycetota bacterium]|jgi:O-acetyl-ADP-ribose deacetylase (regulator of RNase III)|nr:macro domain-containing protein [Planctomycetales bacterium]RLT09871.1 MAG: RNase III inhibitor [Planctomycetota bacterium]
MIVKLGPCRLEFVQGDITQQHVAAIVNAANPALAGGGGVDGAIHTAGGPSIMHETQTQYPEGCALGNAVATGAGDLPAKFVFHAVGPIWKGGRQGEPEQLAMACRACLQLAVKHHCASLAFPALSAGAYGYPIDLAAANLIKTTMDFVRWHQKPAVVRFVLYDQGAFGAFTRAVEEVVPR